MTTETLWRAIEWAAFLWSGTLCGLAGVALLVRWFLRLPKPAATQSLKPWLLIRPCAGDEPTLQRCLASVADAQVTAPLEVVFLFAHAEDTALPVAEQAAQDLEARGFVVRIHVAAPSERPNQKATMLSDILDSCDAELALSVDSNVDLTGFNLDAVGHHLLGDSTLGAVWVPHAERRQDSSLGSRASEAVIGGSLHAFSLLCALDPRGLVGKLFAVRPQALKAAGGFHPLSDYLGEDFELAKRLQAAGWGVAPYPSVVSSMGPRRSMRDTIDRTARWMAVVRAQRPWLMLSYPLLFAGSPAALLLSLMCTLVNPVLGIASAIVTLASRWALAYAAAAHAERTPSWGQAVVDSALSDFVILVAWAKASLTRNVRWRGRKLRITRGGRLVKA